MKRSYLTLLALLVTTARLAADASIGFETPAWGQTDDPNAAVLHMYDSNGSLLNNTASFELGTWTSGFTPTALNVANWQSNWHVLDTDTAANGGWYSLDPSDSKANVSDPNDFTSNAQYLSNNIHVQPTGAADGQPGSLFTVGDQVYLWAYTTKTIASDTEWALVTDSSTGPNGGNDIWKMPNFTGDFTNSPSVAWSITSADTAVFGSVNGVTGAGTQNVDPGTNRLQTFNLGNVSVVPEPGPALLVMFAGLALRLRRRQRYE